MKKISFSIIVLLFTIVSTANAVDIAGTYAGNVTSPQGTVSAQVSLASEESGTYALIIQLPHLGDTTLPGITATEAENNVIALGESSISVLGAIPITLKPGAKIDNGALFFTLEIDASTFGQGVISLVFANGVKIEE
jgi:hypothetical protein